MTTNQYRILGVILFTASIASVYFLDINGFPFGFFMGITAALGISFIFGWFPIKKRQ